MLQLEIEGIDALVEDAKKLVEVCPRSMSNALFKVAKILMKMLIQRCQEVIVNE